MFYDDMVKYYSEIFPVGDKADFLHEHFLSSGPLLDVGCSNGNVAMALATLGYTLDAIDLSSAMIRSAVTNNTYPERLRFQEMNMMSLTYPNNAFQGVFCIGNTLVHLQAKDIDPFLKSIYERLKSDGKFILQILNYEKILKEKPEQLPLIETDHILFERHYQYRSTHIDFITRLMDKKEGLVFENSVPLYPLFTRDLIEHLSRAGFVCFEQYGSFAGTPYTDQSLTSIVVCTKP